MLGSPILYLKGMRAIMFQLSGFYSRVSVFGRRLRVSSGVCGFRASGGGLRLQGFRFRLRGFRFKLRGFRFRVRAFRFGVRAFRFGVQG